ncbi:cation acetate symporter [Planctomycetaceae bacterium]|jgi:cation/acetate symporter|nr:cation acetate symporter [Planctomycetaceae bacterium]
MNYETSTLAIVIFFAFVAFTLGLSFYLGGKAKSSAGYFAAHGQIPWFVNGVAFAGDYLSAASFLGICGMIAFSGYDGFLYSIGFLAGWIVALFVIAEPMKRLGKFTFADALDAKFQSKGVKLAAGISTLAVSIFYLIPQMVGAGVLVQPLLGFPHWVGVVIVGSVVIMIVVTAGMVSTTWVQFLKGSLLVIFSTVLVAMLLTRGFEVTEGGNDGYAFKTLTATQAEDRSLAVEGYEVVPPQGEWKDSSFVQLSSSAGMMVFSKEVNTEGQITLHEAQTVTITEDGEKLINGKPHSKENDLHPVGRVSKLPGDKKSSGPVGLLSFFSTLQESEVVLWRNQKVKNEDGSSTTVYFQKPTAGSRVLRPGEHPKFAGIRSDKFSDKLNFISLMLALFCGTASLPHILIRYYTVKDGAAARKSTIVGIASIGFFYVLTLYMGLGAMTSGAMDVTNSNMAAPLLAKSMENWLFAVISAIAFTTVLGTVSGLILASAGAVAHDLAGVLLKEKLDDAQLVRVAKITSVVVGAIAIVLGILFEKMNVGFLVGWAFSVAASANLPSLVMLLFWKKTTKQGITAAVMVGMISSLAWILLSGDTFKTVYKIDAVSPVPFDQPGIVTIPLGFITLWVVSLMTQPKEEQLIA